VKALREWLLRKLLTPAQRMVLASIEAPARWLPEQEITDADKAQLRQLFTSPLMLKVDVAMINLAHQAAQQAIMAPSTETVRQAGYALGMRAGWQIAKSISTLTSAEAGATEGETDTAGSALAHLNP
jgi:hypothetical protein